MGMTGSQVLTVSGALIRIRGAILPLGSWTTMAMALTPRGSRGGLNIESNASKDGMVVFIMAFKLLFLTNELSMYVLAQV